MQEQPALVVPEVLMMTRSTAVADPLNAHVADRLDEVGGLLESRGANAFRVQAYHRAAKYVRELPEAVDDILDREGVVGLERLPTIGGALARAIDQLVTTGRLPLLERLRATDDPVARLASVAGIGQKLARRVHEQLGIETLEDLEAAAHDGRLARVAGFGEKRLLAVRESLATRLGRPHTHPMPPDLDPPVAEVLDVDREYCEESAAGRLRRIAPRRFNPGGEAWLPILQTTRGGRRYTGLFSNTARAHELGKTNDWVVLYYGAGGRERQCTVVTATTGALKGRRVVRGREDECAEHYRRTDDVDGDRAGGTRARAAR